MEGVSCWWSQGFGCWGYPGEVSYRNECRGCMRTPCSTKKVEVRECSAREGPSTGDGSVSSTRTGVGRPCVGTKEGSDREDCARCTHLKHNLFARFTTCAKKQRTNANPPQGSNEINTKKHTTAHPDLRLDNFFTLGCLVPYVGAQCRKNALLKRTTTHTCCLKGLGCGTQSQHENLHHSYFSSAIRER